MTPTKFLKKLYQLELQGTVQGEEVFGLSNYNRQEIGQENYLAITGAIFS